jgi:hypothetical protein
MKVLVALFVLVAGFAASAAAGDYTMENRQRVVFPSRHGGIVHQTPYPQSYRSSSIWSYDACWRDCSSSCNAAMIACTPVSGADNCRPQLDACDRSCQRSCRSPWAGPVLSFVDW